MRQIPKSSTSYICVIGYDARHAATPSSLLLHRVYSSRTFLNFDQLIIFHQIKTREKLQNHNSFARKASTEVWLLRSSTTLNKTDERRNRIIDGLVSEQRDSTTSKTGRLATIYGHKEWTIGRTARLTEERRKGIRPSFRPYHKIKTGVHSAAKASTGSHGEEASKSGNGRRKSRKEEEV